jgi:adenylate cyclase, class 2
VCEAIGAEDRGLLVQRDTYFNVPHGRLKLREEDGGAPHLIAYERPDRVGGRESRYRIVEVDRVGELKAALSAALGVKAVVAKERRLFIWEGNVRIHLDVVEGLGAFIEFEAIASADSELTQEEAQVKRLRQRFEIEDAELIGGSYCDLMLCAWPRLGHGSTEWRRWCHRLGREPSGPRRVQFPGG